MKKMKKLYLSGTVMSLMLLLSGCMSYDKSGNPTGFIYNYLVVPTQKLMVMFADFFGNYGIAIIVITIIVRLIILPLNLNQSKKSMVQQEKMALVKPEIDEIQAALKAAKTNEEKAEIQQEMMQFYKENDISMMGGVGCLPLLVQLPIFTAMFQAVRLSPEIANSTFLGFNLGETSVLLALLAGATYFGQSYISMIGMAPEQKKQMRTMMFMSPVMITFVSFTSPAGLALYWLTGGIFAIFQTMITNFYHKPRIKAQIAEQNKNRPITPKKKRQRTMEQMKETTINKDATSRSGPNNKKHTTQARNAGKQKPGSGRNAGKQQR